MPRRGRPWTRSRRPLPTWLPRSRANMTAMEEIAAFADVPVEIEAELDRRILSVGQILQMEPGSLIGMKRAAGKTIDLDVGGTLIGGGEIVVVENPLGVRITDFNCDV